MKVEVVCYSCYKGDERPVRFRLGGQDYFVEDLLDQWYEPQDVFFKVKANEGNVYILRRRSATPEPDWYTCALSSDSRSGQCSAFSLFVTLWVLSLVGVAGIPVEGGMFRSASS